MYQFVVHSGRYSVPNVEIIVVLDDYQKTQNSLSSILDQISDETDNLP